MQIFVANIPFATREEDLVQLFHPYGDIERVQIITDLDTGRSRGLEA